MINIITVIKINIFHLFVENKCQRSVSTNFVEENCKIN